MQNLFALVDCNNFFVSCERLFRPDLMGKPVVVLSNNDGCIVSRSNEAKALGLPMGAPIFKWKHIINRHNVTLLSSNFSLYGDISARVMSVLSDCNPSIEIYSIDEAFLDVNGIANTNHYGHSIKNQVAQWVGIPVSIGIASTKTLSKAANHCAKKDPTFNGVCSFSDTSLIDSYLANLPIKDVWGIGWNYAKLLKQYGIDTALKLKNADDIWIRKKLSICGLKTVWELRGIPSIKFDEATPSRKSICSSEMFGKAVTKLSELKEALATYVSRVAVKLRSQKLLANHITVILATSRFNEASSRYYNNLTQTLAYPTAYTPALITNANKALEKLYRSGYAYKKIYVILTGLVSEKSIQPHLFNPLYPGSKNAELMKALDHINNRWGTATLHSAGEGIQKSWRSFRSHHSGNVTTKWNALPSVKA